MFILRSKLKKSTFSPAEVLSGLIQIENDAKELETIDRMEIRYVSRLISNRYGIDTSFFNNGENKTSKVLFATEKNIFTTNLSILSKEKKLYYFSIRVPFYSPNSYTGPFYKFVNYIEIFVTLNRKVNGIKIPFLVCASGKNIIDTFREKLIYFEKVYEVPYPNIFSKKIDIDSFEFEPEYFYDINQEKKETKTFYIRAGENIIANINATKEYFSFDEPVTFKIDVNKKCKLVAKLFCINTLNPELKEKGEEDDFLVDKQLKDEKEFDLSYVNWQFIELNVPNNHLPTSSSPMGKIEWVVNFRFIVEENNLEREYKINCMIPVYKSRRLELPAENKYFINV